MNFEDEASSESDMPVFRLPRMARKKKRNPKRNCSGTALQRKNRLLRKKKLDRRVHNECILQIRRGIPCSVRTEKAVVIALLQYASEVDVWLHQRNLHLESGLSVEVLLKRMKDRSPAIIEATSILDNITDLFLDSEDNLFIWDAVMDHPGTVALMSSLLTEPSLAAGRIAVQITDHFARWMMPEISDLDPKRSSLTMALLDSLATTSMKQWLHKCEAILAMAAIMGLMEHQASPIIVSFCGFHALNLLHQPGALSQIPTTRVLALFTSILVDQHDVDSAMRDVVNAAPAYNNNMMATVDPGGTGQAQPRAPADHLFLLSPNLFSQFLMTVLMSVQQCSTVSSSLRTAGRRNCHCHLVVLDVLWCLNICSHYIRPMAMNIVAAQEDLSTIRQACQHFLPNKKRWICSLALLQLVNNLIVWIPIVASKICESFGALLCKSIIANLAKPPIENMQRCAFHLAASFIKTPHCHDPNFKGCVMENASIMTELATALQHVVHL